MLDLKAITPMPTALMRSTARGPLVSSDRPQWWYLATLPLSGPVDAPIQISVDVRAGVVGISLIGDDESALWGEAEAAIGRHTVCLSVAPGDPEPRAVLFRSCAPDNRPAVLVVEAAHAGPKPGAG